MGLHYAARNREAESMPGSSALALATEERLEDSLELLRRHARTFVGNRELNRTAGAIELGDNLNLAAGRRVPRGVAHDVFERTVQHLGVAPNIRGTDRVQIHLVERTAFIFRATARQEFEAFDEGFGLATTMGLDDADNDAPGFNPPDADRPYVNYVETCRRLGVEPVSRDRAQNLIAEWTDAIAARQPPLH